MLLQRHTGATDTRRHDVHVDVEQSKLRWCSDAFEIGCDNKEKVRVAFAPDCCDREAIALEAAVDQAENLIIDLSFYRGRPTPGAAKSRRTLFGQPVGRNEVPGTRELLPPPAFIGCKIYFISPAARNASSMTP